MNGETKELLNELEKKLLVLDTRHEERWKSHEIRAGELKGWLEGEIKQIKDTLCCVPKHGERIKHLGAILRFHWAILAIMVSGCVGGFWFLIRR